MKYKKGIILVELIFTIVIISIVSIFTMTFLYNLYNKLTNEYSNEINKLESSSTNILLNKIFANAYKINLSGTNISFYKEDSELFDLGYYSRFVDLNNNTTKNVVYSPNTYAEELIDYHITFDDENFYSIKNDSNGYIINLDDQNPKTIKEQYKIVSIDQTISCKDSKLYYNSYILLEDISKCEFSIDTDTIHINLVKDDIPLNYTFKIKN